MNWVAWKNTYGKQPKIKYNGLSFFSDIWRIPSLLRKKKATQFCSKKADDFPSGSDEQSIQKNTAELLP